MKKRGIIVGFLATAFGLAVVNKMQAEGTLDQVIGASKEVLDDLKQSISGIAGAGTSEKLSGKASEAVGNVTGDIKAEFER